MDVILKPAPVHLANADATALECGAAPAGLTITTQLAEVTCVACTGALLRKALGGAPRGAAEVVEAVGAALDRHYDGPALDPETPLPERVADALRRLKAQRKVAQLMAGRAAGKLGVVRKLRPVLREIEIRLHECNQIAAHHEAERETILGMVKPEDGETLLEALQRRLGS